MIQNVLQIVHTIAVIICAYTQDRWDDLVAAVESVQQQTFPPSEIILVIDHNPALLERVREHIPSVVVVENTEVPGLRGARNSGIRAAQSSVIAFLDDDAVAPPDWLKFLCEGYTNPQVLGTGGAVTPLWLDTEPAWLPEEFYWVVGCSYRGMPRTDAAIRNPIGANMSFRREVFETVGDFHSEIVHIGKRHAGGCEETELCIRARQHWPQSVFLYHPRANVFHRVPASRTSWHYFYSRCYVEGLAKAAIAQCMGAKDSLASERTYTLRTLPQGVLRNLADALFQHDRAGLARAGAIIAGLVVTTVGYLVGSILLRGAKLKHSLATAPLYEGTEPPVGTRFIASQMVADGGPEGGAMRQPSASPKVSGLPLPQVNVETRFIASAQRAADGGPGGGAMRQPSSPLVIASVKSGAMRQPSSSPEVPGLPLQQGNVGTRCLASYRVGRDKPNSSVPMSLLQPDIGCEPTGCGETPAPPWGRDKSGPYAYPCTMPKNKNIPILMYHSISSKASTRFKPFTVPPAVFADQMAYLHQHAYTPMTVTQFIHARTQGGGALPERPVVLTFDDGFADFFTEALPVLQQYGFVATLYVATAFLNGTSRWLQHEGEATRPMLTWEQLSEISRCGIECGGHSHTHRQLDTLPQTVARDEIVHCKQLLEDHLGKPVASFAYPCGYHSAAVQRLVREAGYTSACAVKYEMSSETTDPFALARLLAHADTDGDALSALLSEPGPSMVTSMYKSVRVPLWRLARRYQARGTDASLHSA